MGRGTSGAAEAPVYDGACGPADEDARLVAAVRRGDDRAFEHLYSRYHRRIHAYVLGMVKDHGRAEDVTQEVFVSALRRMRETAQPLAFKPWLYQIAKNSCIDAFRRSRRAEEVSYDADDALAPSDHSRLVGGGPSPDAAVAAKQDLESLCGAFGGLSETHHEILVLRELEGLSYQEIGRRMGMSRPAVESTLFRARRRLTEEFDDIVSGARCQRIQGIITTATESRLGTRDTRRLARHLAHCQPCRREALAAGLDRGLFARPSVRERVATKVAGILPFPAFLRFRRGASDTAAAPSGGRGGSFTAHLPMLSDQFSAGWGKVATGAALLIAGVGAGVGVHEARKPSTPPAAVQAGKPAAATITNAAQPHKTAATSHAPASGTTASSHRGDAGSGGKKLHTAAHRRSVGSGSSSAAGRATTAGGGTANTTPAASGAAPSSSSSASSGGGGGKSDTPALKAPDAPAGAGETTKDAVKQTTGAVQQTTSQTTGAVRDTTHETTGAVDGAVNQVTGGGAVGGTADGVTDTVDGAVDGATGAVDQTVDQVTGAVNGIAGGGG